MKRPITTYYLEMTNPSQASPKLSPRTDLVLGRVTPPIPELNRFFYHAIGGDWYWYEKRQWTREQWLSYVTRPALETWVLSVSGVPAGYFELDAQPNGSTEIAYFGLLAPFIGGGLGSHMLTGAVTRAWQAGAKRVWVHTCTEDHPHALAHYKARGFKVYREESNLFDLPDVLPW